ENDGDGVVPLCLRDEEIQQETFAAACGTQNKRVADVVNVQGEVVGGLVTCFEDRQRFPIEVAALRLAAIQREQEAQVRAVRLQKRQATQVVSAVAWHDAEPSVQKVVGFLDENAIVSRDHLDRLGRHTLHD